MKEIRRLFLEPIQSECRIRGVKNLATNSPTPPFLLDLQLRLQCYVTSVFMLLDCVKACILTAREWKLTVVLQPFIRTVHNSYLQNDSRISSASVWHRIEDYCSCLTLHIDKKSPVIIRQLACLIQEQDYFISALRECLSFSKIHPHSYGNCS